MMYQNPWRLSQHRIIRRAEAILETLLSCTTDHRQVKKISLFQNQFPEHQSAATCSLNALSFVLRDQIFSKLTQIRMTDCELPCRWAVRIFTTLYECGCTTLTRLELLVDAVPPERASRFSRALGKMLHQQPELRRLEVDVKRGYDPDSGRQARDMHACIHLTTMSRPDVCIYEYAVLSRKKYSFFGGC